MTRSQPSSIVWEQADGKPSLWLDLLQCGLKNVYIDSSKLICTLELPGYNCTDMSGAIALSKHVLPDVKMVATFNSRGWDTRYVKGEDGHWAARLIAYAGPANVYELSPDAKPVALEQIVQLLVDSGDHVVVTSDDVEMVKPPAEGC